MTRIGFFGTPTLAARVLSDLLLSSEIEVAFVVTNPDKPIGRTSELQASPVKEIAIKNAVEVFQPLKIRENTEFLEKLESFDCDYFVVVAYGKILPKVLLDIPKKKCINVHGSILPKYRGASPIQSVLLHGEKETGVTIMEMSEGMDEGDILKIRRIYIDEKETSLTLFEKFADISGATLIQTLLELEHGGITPLIQNNSEATYCKKIEKTDGIVNWSKSAKEIYHMWQAYTPWPGIYTMYEEKRLRLERVNYLSETLRDAQIGQVIQLQNGVFGITCGEGVLTLEQVKLEGKKMQDIKDFVNGNQKFRSYIFLFKEYLGIDR